MTMQVSPHAAMALALAAALTASLPTAASAQVGAQVGTQVGKTVTTPSGLKMTDTVVGTGAAPRRGQTCVMHYTGWLYQTGAKGQKFDARLPAASRSSCRSGCSGSSQAGTKAWPQ